VTGTRDVKVEAATAGFVSRALADTNQVEAMRQTARTVVKLFMGDVFLFIVTTNPLGLGCLGDSDNAANAGGRRYRAARIKSFTTLMGMTMKKRKNKPKIAPNPL
jgi:hypothetical protein